MTSGLAGLQSMNESRQPVREVEVSRVPLIAIWLQSDESLCIWAEGKRGGRGCCTAFFFLSSCVCMCPSMHVRAFRAVKLRSIASSSGLLLAVQYFVNGATALQH